MLNKRTHLIDLILLYVMTTGNLFSQSLATLMIKSSVEKIEFGVNYNYYQSLIFQETFIAQNYQSYFQNNGAFSPYLSLKSKGFELSDKIGIYLNSHFNYMFFNMQKAVLTDGSVSQKSVDLETSIHYLALDITPSIFYFYNFGQVNGKNSIIFELFSGIGISVYTGSSKEFIYPTKDEFKNSQNQANIGNPPNFYISNNGEIAYIGNKTDIGFGIGINLLYGLKVKYNFNNMNIHISYKSPFAITLDNYLNIQQLAIGIGYSF